MAVKVLILGDSGTGKSASLRNFNPDEVLVINAAGKPLPFKNHFECVTPAFNKMTSDVIKAMDSTSKKVIIIDDAQYIMSFQYMRRIKENGWDKWNDIQGDFFNIIQHCDELPADVTVYILSHIQRDEEGREKLKTMGKMLDEKITLEGLFTVVLKTSVQDGEYCFITQNSGKDTVKSPIGMFDTYAIDNDLKYVDAKIRNYYELGDYSSDDVLAAMDQESSKPDVEKPSAEGRRRRSRTTADNTEEPKTTDSGSTDNTKAEKPADVTIDDHKEAAPVQRRRKARNDENKEEVHKEAPAEEAKAEAADEGSSINNVRNDEEPKRRRRRRTEVADDQSVADLVKDSGIADDYQLPFEV